MLSNYPVLRDRLYLFYGILGLILGSYASYQGALGADTADWYQGGIAAYGYSGVGLGFLASSNTDTAVSGGAAPVHGDEPEDRWLDDEAAA